MVNQTIAAIATPLGTGGIGVVRISGGDAFVVAERLLKTVQYQRIADMPGYTCAYGRAYDSDGDIDEVVITAFRAPRSFTGENVIEIASHGGVYIVNRILRACCDRGARPALAGEFTKRAFLNGKMDLTGAEAVADLISAQGRQAAKAALAAHDGALFRRIDAVSEKLIGQASHLAAWIDYPEEEIIDVDEKALLMQLKACRTDLKELLDSYDTGKVIREGINAAIVGRPNVGKSTLMNLLTGYNRSIVADLAGTTRDVVSDTIQLGEIVLHLSDTAGIRLSDDPVEQAGVQLAQEQLAQAQLVLAVFDGSTELNSDDQRVIESCKEVTCIALVNKNDLPQKLDMDIIQAHFKHVIVLSAKAQDGAKNLKNTIRDLFKLGEFDASAAMVSNERQRAGVISAVNELDEAIEALDMGVSYDAVCVCIENAVDCLLELTGKRASQEVVDQVFARFCVGK